MSSRPNRSRSDSPPHECLAQHTRLGRACGLEFMDDVSIDRAVLYPAGWLAVDKVINGDFPIDSCQAYNNWFNDTYLKTSGKFQNLGLIPMQEPTEAMTDLRRIVEELGFFGAMLPSIGLKGNLGGKEYWTVYAEPTGWAVASESTAAPTRA